MKTSFLTHRHESARSSLHLLQTFWQKNFFECHRLQSEKQIRKSLIELGYFLAGGSSEDPEALQKISLIAETDEKIEEVRRGPFNEKQKLLMFEALIEAFGQFQRGQSLDLNFRLEDASPATIRESCVRSLELKNGSVVSMLLKIGALFAPENSRPVASFGQRYGMALQILNDVGCLEIEKKDSNFLKDLILRRPNWIWVVLGEQYSQKEWSQFRKAVEALPDKELLKNLLDCSRLREKAFSQARRELASILQILKNEFQLSASSNAFQMALKLSDQISHSFYD